MLNDSTTYNESSYFEVLLDGSTQEWAVIGASTRTQEVREGADVQISESFSPPIIESNVTSDSQRNKVNDYEKSLNSNYQITVKYHSNILII